MSQSRAANGDLKSFDGNKELLQRVVRATSPGVTDDEGEGYEVGSVWVNSVLALIFVCMDATDGAAVWREEALANVAATNPGVTNDVDEGYIVGSHWINSTQGRIFICLDITDGAAVWRELVRDNVAAGSPGVTNDIDEGYAIGSTWIATTQGRVFVCMDNADGAAVWREQVKNNVAAAADPGVTNDIDEGYSVGSHWTNETDDGVFICTNNADGAAVWLEITLT